MSAGSLAAGITVPFFGVLLCAIPAVSRPTVAFGVRVPPERTGAAVIARQRRAYYWRTAAIGVCCTVAALFLRGSGPWWLTRIILLTEVAADLGCVVIARKNIIAVKNAEHWFAGRRQIVVTDTSWRTDPPRFPVRWLIPALAVLTATVVIGVLRYPVLPARLAVGLTAGPGHLAPKSVVRAFAVVAGQCYVTVLWTGLFLLVYRSRPDLEAADPVGSAVRYRRFLAVITKAVLTLLALVNLTLLLAALRTWQVYRLSGIGSALPLLPFAAGLIIFAAAVFRTGQGGFRLSRGARGGCHEFAGGTDRDDDRFWKAGLFYVNRGDPALMVASRVGVGWTLNLANPAAWLLIATVAAVPAGLAAIAAAAGI
jgi:uncharacterized membrane protein